MQDIRFLFFAAQWTSVQFMTFCLLGLTFSGELRQVYFSIFNACLSAFYYCKQKKNCRLPIITAKSKACILLLLAEKYKNSTTDYHRRVSLSMTSVLFQYSASVFLQYSGKLAAGGRANTLAKPHPHRECVSNKQNAGMATRSSVAFRVNSATFLCGISSEFCYKAV